MRDLKVYNGVFDDSRDRNVSGGDDVSNVAVDEDVTGLQAEESGFGDAGVGAADPDCGVSVFCFLRVREERSRRTNGRCLAFSLFGEKRRILVIFVACPCGIRA